MHVFIIGLNHATAPVEIRERIAFTASSASHALREISQHVCVSETVLLSTCNRTEVYAASNSPSTATEVVREFLDHTRGRNTSSLSPYLYHYTDQQCVEHLFRVASGIDSMVVGECQILAQVKEAFDTARRAGVTHILLDELFRRAMRVGKRARTETDISVGALSVGSAAVELAKTVFGKLEGCSILLLGAGKASELTSRYLVENGVSTVIVANRSHARALELAVKFGGTAIRFDVFPEYLRQADIVISSTSAPHFVVTADAVTQAMRARRERPMFLIDIAVPRDIDPEVSRLANVFLYDIDDLESVVEANRAERQREVHRVEAIIEREVNAFMRWFRGLEVQPVMAALAKKADMLRKEEVERVLQRLTHLSPKDRDVVCSLAKSLTQKIIHEPLVCLRQSSESANGYIDAEMVRRLFNLPISECPNDVIPEESDA